MEKVIQGRPTDDNYRQLQEAIIKQAVKDYLYAYFGINYARCIPKAKEIEKFFLSNWGDDLCDGNGERVLKQTRMFRDIASKIVYKYEKGFFYTRVPEDKEITKRFSTLYSKFHIVNGCYALYGVEVLLNLMTALKDTDYEKTLVDIDENNENK